MVDCVDLSSGLTHKRLTDRFARQSISVPKVGTLNPNFQCAPLDFETIIPVVDESFRVCAFSAGFRAIETDGVEALVYHPIQVPTDKIADIVHLLAHLELYAARGGVEHSHVWTIRSVSAYSGTDDSQLLHLLWSSPPSLWVRCIYLILFVWPKQEFHVAEKVTHAMANIALLESEGCSSS